MKAGWCTAALGEVVARIETVDPTKNLNEHFTYVDVSSVSNETYEITQTSQVLGRDAPSRARRLMRTDDVIFATIRPTLKRIASVPSALDQQVCSTGYMVLRSLPKLHPRFLFHYLFTDQFQGAMEELQTGASYPAVTDGQVRQQPIPLPPLEEQQRIVAVLDEAFEGLARARAHAEANLQNARELFENSLSAFIDRHKESWSSTTLGEAYDVRDGTHDSPKYHTTGRALITSKNLGRDGLHFEKVKFISEEDFELICKRSGVHKGDVLFAMIGTIGNPIVVEVEPDFAIKNVALFKMKEARSGQFLCYMLRSKQVVDKMKAEAKGTTQQFVGLGYLRAFPIILPKQPKEMALVDDLDRMETQCRSAEDLYEKKLQDLDDLRQSLLRKAFAGELTLCNE